MKRSLRPLFVRVQRFLAPPHFINDHDGRLAPILNTILWAGLALTLAYLIASLLLPPSPFLDLPIELGILSLHAIGLLLLHRGLPRVTAVLYTIGLWWIVCTATLGTREITSAAVSSLYTVILIAGILLGPRGSFSLVVLSTLGVIYNFLLIDTTTGAQESSDWLPAITVTTNFILVAVVAWLGQRSIISSLTSAQSSRTLLSHRSAQLQAAAEIGTATATSRELSVLLETITQVIAERFGFYHVAILTHDPTTHELTLVAISQGGKKSSAPPAIHVYADHGKSIIAHVARTQKPYLASDVKMDPLYLPDPQLEETRSEIALPIISGEKLFGVLDVLSNQESPLGQDEMNTLLVLTNQIGAAIQNKTLLEAANRHLEELIALHAIATAGMEEADEDKFLSRATKVVGKSLFPTNFGVLLLNEKQGVLLHHASYTENRGNAKSPPIPLGEGITGLVAATGEPMRVKDVSVEPKYISLDPRVHSELCVPLKIGERVLGVLDVESHQTDAFSKADEHLLLALADQIATALERIRLLSEAERRADELARTLKQQEELARLRDEFIQNVSHEFRTPLSIVTGYTEILDSGEFGPLPAEYKQPVSIIAKRVRLLTKLVEDLTSLLDLQAHRGDFTSLHIGDVLHPMYAGIRTRALAERIELDLDLPSGLPLIRGEETLLRKVVENLVDNAIKFTPPHGRVHLSVKSDDGHLWLEISDTGIGIPKEEQPRIFERFYQVDGSSTRRFGGTGLGLALVKEIVELHGGQIFVNSKVGQGSTFQIKLPALED
jgi:signal transduction histidine kinase